MDSRLVRKYAAEQAIAEEEALEKGLEEFLYHRMTVAFVRHPCAEAGHFHVRIRSHLQGRGQTRKLLVAHDFKFGKSAPDLFDEINQRLQRRHRLGLD